MEATRESIDTLAIILPYMNELRTLEVRPMTRDAGADLLLAALSNMPNNKRFESFKFGLRRLGMISLRWSVLIEFLKNATGLKNLSLGTIDFLSDNEDSSSSPSSPCFRGGSSDVQQEENENHESIQDRILCTTLTTDPRNRSTPAPPGPFRNILQLQLGNSVMSRSQVIDFMSMLPNLSTIDLRFGLGSWSPLFLESLMATGLVQFPTLRRLNLTWYTGIEHMVLAWFLEASPNLQHLSLAGQWASDGSSGLGKMAEVLQQRQNRIRLRSLKCLWSDHLSEGTADLIAFLSLETCQDLEEIELSQNPSFMTNLLEAHERELEKERQQREQLHLPTATTPTGNNSNTRDSASSFLTPQPEQERPWFRFSRSLTSLRLTGYHGQAASPELTKTLNRLLRQFPRLIDLAITVYFQSYALFDSLGHCPGTTTERTHLLQIDSNVNDWLEERPFLQRLSIRFDDGFRIVPEEFQREIVDRFRFLDSIQLVAEVKGEDENKVFEAWRRRLRPGLQLRFSSEMESLSEQLSL
ncbi:hypothetical protein BGZ83_008969 [Gryganskiella cystojenkinii]|nr:hypothetical protein BGZ83_008969 [Gryganskiella cystojenkinii]